MIKDIRYVVNYLLIYHTHAEIKLIFTLPRKIGLCKLPHNQGIYKTPDLDHYTSVKQYSSFVYFLSNVSALMRLACRSVGFHVDFVVIC